MFNIFNNQKKINPNLNKKLYDPETGEQIAEIKDGKLFINGKANSSKIVNDTDS